MQQMPETKIATQTQMPTKESNAKQEIHGAVKCCANTDGIFKTTNNSNESTGNTNTNTLTKYFLSCSKNETDKGKVLN